MKKLVSLLLVLVMVFSLAACNNESGDSSSPANSGGQPSANDGEPAAFTPLTYEESAIYEGALGEFYDLYQEAKAAENLSERWALMALAEGKLLASGAVSLSICRGGSYAISRLAGRTQTGILFGNDADRSHQAVVATEFIRSEDQAALRAEWNELRGTGTFLQWAKDYLVEHGYTLSDTYGYLYATDPTTWDIFATSQQADTEPVVQTYDGLMEYDCEQVQQPALATGYEISEDGLTYTFHIREGQVWVDSQGRKVADVKADDWVAGMQHLLDAKGGLQPLLYGVIVNAMEYDLGEITDFSQVGVKAEDDYTLVYTLEAPCAYLPTMLGYSIFAPLSRDYYTSQGGKFGLEYDPTAADYNYGKSPSNIAYNGPYLVTSYTDHNSILYTANPSYWNPDNVTCKTLNWYYNDGSDATKSYEDAKAGLLNGCAITASTLELARAELTNIPRENAAEGEPEFLTYYEAYHYNSATDATTFMGFYNLNRQAFANYNDDTKMVSPQDHASVDEIDLDNGVYTSDIEDTAARTHVAINNQNFRLALTLALDREAWNAPRYGEELALVSLLNTIVPGNFVSLEEEVTVNINGTPTTFPAATPYGEIVQAQIDADGIPVKVWNEELGDTVGFDGWYNLSAARSYMEAAIEELAAQGVEISAENPIEIDYVFNETVESYNNQAQVFKQCMDAAFEGKVQVNLVGGDSDAVSDATYQPSNGNDMNYDLSHQTGWGPDYGDPQTWLECFERDGGGYMTTSLGLWQI